MSSHAPAPLELERIPLPPIPGPLPHTFFTETPLTPLAVFSTHLSTRPFRNLPNPVPPHVIRSANHDDVSRKAWSLLRAYPEVAESIFTPPGAWLDLYHYFDAMDLWTEGAGFLFHVLGFIVRVNWTKFNCLRVYADQWAITHEMRLIDMPKLQPDLLSSVFTAEDDAWFDVGSLTPYQKNALTVVLNSHRDVLRAKHDSLRIDRQRKAEWAGRKIQRPPNVQSSEPHQDNERPITPSFKPSSQRLSGASPPFIPTKMTTQQEIKSEQGLTGSKPYGENESLSRVYTKPHVFTREAAPASKVELGGNYVDRRLCHPESSFQNLASSRGGLRNAHTSGPSQTHFQRGSGPVYIFNGQKRSAETKNEIASASGRPSLTLYPIYHTQQHIQMCIQGNNTPGASRNVRRSNTASGYSNDARVYYEDEFVRRQDEGARFRNQNINKFVRPDDNREIGCTVFVGGLSDEALEKQTARELLSKCGVIKSVKSLHGKGCCFVEFASMHSAVEAIYNFHKYVTEEGLTLTVQHARPKGTNPTIHSDAHRERGATAQNLHYNATSPPSHQVVGYSRRTTGQSSSSFSPPDSTPSTINSSPPHALPSKPQSRSFTRGFPPSTGFDSQINFVDRLIQTASGNGLPARLNEARASVDECTNDRFGRNTCGPQNKPENSCKKKKKYRQQKSESPSSTPTHTPTKKPLSGPSEDHATSDSSKIREPPSKVDSPASKSSVIIFESSSGDAEIVSNQKFPNIQNTSTSSDPTGLEERQSTPEPGSKAQAVTPTDVKTLDASIDSVDDDGKVLPMRKCSDVTLGDAPRARLLETAEVTESLPLFADSIGLIEAKQNRKTSSNNKRKSAKMSKAGIKWVAKTVNPAAHSPPAADNAKESSEGSLELRLKARCNQKTSATGTCHDAQAVSENPRRGSQTDAKRDTCSRNIIQAMPTPPNGHSSQKPKRGEQPSLSKIDSSEDIFSDCIPKAAHGRQMSDVGSPAKFQTNSSPRSSVPNAGSAAKKSKTQARDKSPTTKGLRRKSSETNGKNFERKENIKPPPSTGLLLSDLSQWPALGTGKAQIDLKPTKPLVDRTPQPGPIRRDSLASVVSSASPRHVRRLTATAASPPSSGGSPLWPVVKRWDSYKTSTKQA